MAANEIVFTVSFVRKLKSGSEIGTATGFFYERSGSLFLATNRHVVERNDPDALRLRLHTSNEDLTKSEDVDIALYDSGHSPLWASPPTQPDADVAVALLDGQRFPGRFIVKA